MSGANGINGGWAQSHGAPLATTTSIFLSIDEDQVADSERSHISEQIAYAVFRAAPAAPPVPGLPGSGLATLGVTFAALGLRLARRHA